MSYRQRVYATYVSQKTQASGYRYNQASYELWSRATHARLNGWLPADQSLPILDMGCGPGNLLYLLTQDGYTNLTGIDLSIEQIELAHQWCPAASILHGDVQEFLQQYSDHFGLITGFDIIEHFHKDEQLLFLARVMAALRPGGRLILQTPNAESPMSGAVAYGDFTHEWFFTPTSLADLLRLSGFERYEARPSSPYAHGLKSALRRILWGGVNAGLILWNLAEVGHCGSGIYTRVFVATAVKPYNESPHESTS